jgi:Ni,Fe-hydrogenase III component G
MFPTEASALALAHTILAPWSQTTTAPEPHRLDVALEAADLLLAVRTLAEARWGYLSAITGLDLGPTVNALEGLYHFCSGPIIVTLRVQAPRLSGPWLNATLPSVCAIFPAASIFERELSEMLGITLLNAPDTRRLFLPDDWPEGVYPLRKDAVLP